MEIEELFVFRLIVVELQKGLGNLLLRIDPRLEQVIARHQMARSRANAAEGEGLAFQILKLPDTGILTRDKVALELAVLLAHDDPPGAFGLPRRLDGSQPTVPHHVEFVGGQPFHGGRIVHDWDKLDRHPYFLREIIRKRTVNAQHLLRVLVGDCRYFELFYRRLGGKSCSHRQPEKTKNQTESSHRATLFPASRSYPINNIDFYMSNRKYLWMAGSHRLFRKGASVLSQKSVN